MKKIFLLVGLALLMGSTSFGSFNPGTGKKENPKASELFIPLGTTGKSISLQDLSEISRPDFEQLTSHKMNAGQKAGFKMAQKKLRKMIDDNGRIKNKTLQRAAAGDWQEGFHIGGFALGFVLGLIGVLIAYLISDEKKPKRVKWAWIGFAFWIVIVLIAVII